MRTRGGERRQGVQDRQRRSGLVQLRRLPGGEVIHSQVAMADIVWTRFLGWMGHRMPFC